MKHGYEEEYKVLLTKEEFDALCNCFPSLHFVTQTNHYYHTDSANVSLRVREKEGKQIFTCKIHTDKGLEEHEKVITVPFWQDEEVMDYLQKVSINGPFTEWGQMTTERHTEIVGDNLAELCLDINFYNGITDYEVEYEVQNQHDALSSFQYLLSLANIPYRENKVSKVKRCLQTIRDRE